MCTERLFGVRITLDRLFLLLLFVLALIGLLPEALIVFGIVVVHELAHAAVARSHGLRVIELELLPFGGVARIDGLMEVDPYVEKRVAMAGPITNLFMLGLGVVAKTYALYPEQWLDFLFRPMRRWPSSTLCRLCRWTGDVSIGRIWSGVLDFGERLRKRPAWAGSWPFCLGSQALRGFISVILMPPYRCWASSCFQLPLANGQTPCMSC